jgi:hypothetical protein
MILVRVGDGYLVEDDNGEQRVFQTFASASHYVQQLTSRYVPLEVAPRLKISYSFHVV